MGCATAQADSPRFLRHSAGLSNERRTALLPNVEHVPHRAIHWFQRDLRVADNPALHAAVSAGTDGVLPLFVIDPQTWADSSDVQQAYLLQSLAALKGSLDGNLTIRVGDPRVVIPELADEISAQSVHLAASFTLAAMTREQDVIKRLAEHGARS